MHWKAKLRNSLQITNGSVFYNNLKDTIKYICNINNYKQQLNPTSEPKIH